MKSKLLYLAIGLIAGGFIILLGLNWKRDLPMYHRVGMSKYKVDSFKNKMIVGEPLQSSIYYFDSVKLVSRNDTIYIVDQDKYQFTWVNGHDTILIKKIKYGREK